jgi:hypothetical protein
LSALVGWKAIQKMLDICAPGWSWELAPHYRRILANGRVYPDLPKYDEIENGHVRRMVRHLGIADCAKKEIETLRH